MKFDATRELDVWDPKWDPTLEYDQEVVPTWDSIDSTAVGYFASSNGRIGTQVVTYKITTAVTFESHLRATRKQAKRKAMEIGPVPSAAANGMVVLFGAKIGPRRAIKCLKKMIALIEKHGLVTGYANREGEYWEYEYVDPKQEPRARE